MRVQLAVFGRTLLRLDLELAPDPDNGTDPGDATAIPMPPPGFGVWAEPDIPALERDR